ncbi:DoxX family protein [Mycolicibacterium sp.]|uniref:DoxX family protein n=1 Tax=Mycolicibacterium sp. TaxID=2320850 RepID=UPI003D115EE9
MTPASARVDQTHRDTADPPHPWHPVSRVVFRFCFVYFGLFCLVFAQIMFVYTGIFRLWLPDLAVMWQMILIERPISWVGTHLLGIDAVLHHDSNSGDQAAVWVMVLCFAVIALTATAIWTVLDHRRPDYRRLNAWFLTFLRLCLGGQMLFYGLAKLIPTQMPLPPLAALLRPVGDLSPASVLWLQVGSSPTYQIALGAAETVAGLLLFLPRTATLGAVLSLASMGQVFLLNMTYDVPVKILSSHLLLISLILVAPQLRRLADVFVLHKPAEPLTQPELFASSRRNRIAALVQVVLGVWVLAGCVATTWLAWYEYGGGRPRPELYGIWSVSDFTVDGTTLPPLTSDPTRWQRVVFDEVGVLTYQRMDGELIDAPAAIDGDTLTVAAPDGTAPEATLRFDRDSPDTMRFDGELDGRPVTMTLQRVDPASFTLNSRGFHWVQEYPYFT